MSDETVMRRLVRRLRPVRDTALPHDAVAGDRLTVDQEAEYVVRRYALRCGAVGAIASVPGTAVATALPATAFSTLALQLRMILEIARLYGHQPDAHDFETDALAIMAGEATVEIVRRAGIEWSNQFAWRTLHRAITARAVKQVDAGFGPGGAVVVGVPRPLARLVPLAGAPVGFGIDYAFARAVGSRAIAHYRLQASDPDLR